MNRGIGRRGSSESVSVSELGNVAHSRLWVYMITREAYKDWEEHKQWETQAYPYTFACQFGWSRNKLRDCYIERGRVAGVIPAFQPPNRPSFHPRRSSSRTTRMRSRGRRVFMALQANLRDLCKLHFVKVKERSARRVGLVESLEQAQTFYAEKSFVGVIGRSRIKIGWEDENILGTVQIFLLDRYTVVSLGTGPQAKIQSVLSLEIPLSEADRFGLRPMELGGFVLETIAGLLASLGAWQRLDYAQAILRRWFRRDVAQNRLRIGFDEQNSPNPGHARGTVERDFSKKEHGDGP
ncbi:hypothetical protein BT96DRAFT_972247 [Gymnopus androsaceus JB14]|uniref:Uncharacterized protein n=1 Tax=Gymnopus androsaceus JB14 TaxID=1447944 RepID=A0A6A4I5I5_9AGAR|nr:hypothetical protein BT96DRAFT_972247 [Gymnopus androsaceus JB14]